MSFPIFSIFAEVALIVVVVVVSTNDNNCKWQVGSGWEKLKNCSLQILDSHAESINLSEVINVELGDLIIGNFSEEFFAGFQFESVKLERVKVVEPIPNRIFWNVGRLDSLDVSRCPEFSRRIWRDREFLGGLAGELKTLKISGRDVGVDNSGKDGNDDDDGGYGGDDDLFENFTELKTIEHTGCADDNCFNYLNYLPSLQHLTVSQTSFSRLKFWNFKNLLESLKSLTLQKVDGVVLDGSLLEKFKKLKSFFVNNSKIYKIESTFDRIPQILHEFGITPDVYRQIKNLYSKMSSPSSSSLSPSSSSLTSSLTTSSPLTSSSLTSSSTTSSPLTSSSPSTTSSALTATSTAPTNGTNLKDSRIHKRLPLEDQSRSNRQALKLKSAKEGRKASPMKDSNVSTLSPLPSSSLNPAYSDYIDSNSTDIQTDDLQNQTVPPLKFNRAEDEAELKLESRLMPGRPLPAAILEFKIDINRYRYIVECTVTGNPPVHTIIRLHDKQMRLFDASHKSLEHTVTHVEFFGNSTSNETSGDPDDRIPFGNFTCKAMNQRGETREAKIVISRRGMARDSDDYMSEELIRSEATRVGVWLERVEVVFAAVTGIVVAAVTLEEVL